MASSGFVTWWIQNKIQHRNEKDLISFKHKLELAATERNLRYSKTFDHTAETIVKVYGHLLNVYDAAADFTKLINNNDKDTELERGKKLSQSIDIIREYFRQNKIYIPKRASIKISVFMDILILTVKQHGLLENLAQHTKLTDQQFERFSADIVKSQHRLEELLGDLENEFQIILGFSIAD